MPRSVPIAPNPKRALKNEPSYFRLAFTMRNRLTSGSHTPIGAATVPGVWPARKRLTTLSPRTPRTKVNLT